MTKIIVDNTLRERLHGLVESIELCDDSGRVIARVTPCFEPPITEEELDRREQTTESMTTIVIDESLRERLRGLREPLELCDESGRVLALLTPSIERQSSTEEYDCPFDEAELERRIKSVGKTYTTEEVLAYLEKLDVSN